MSVGTNMPLERLDRIEAKLDKLSDAVVAIARTEEQLTTIFSKHQALETKVDGQSVEIGKLRDKAHTLSNKVVIAETFHMELKDMDKDLEKVKLDTHDNTLVIARIEKVSWAMFTTLLGIVGFLIKEYLLR